MYCRRILENHLHRLSESYPVILLTGARQVGKTTLLRHLATEVGPERTYVSLDEFGPMTLANEDPDLFLQRNEPPLIIDEVQNAPQLLEALKPRVDESGEMGAYWLTGSQHFPLMKKVSESLAGRVAVVELSGLSQAEEAESIVGRQPFRPDRAWKEGGAEDRPELGPTDLLDVYERIVRGSFPRFVQADPPPIDTFYGSYLQTYVERDVRSMASISDLAAFRRFLRIAASRIGQLLNFSDLGRDVGVASSTVSEWMSILEASYQVVLLRPYYANLGKRQVKTPKLYFRDTGVACYLAGWTSAETASSGAMAGELLENYVVMEILKSWEHRGKRAPLWFYRTRQGREVDLLIEEDGELFPIEIKRTAQPNRRDLKGIADLRRSKAKVGRGAVVSLVREPFAIDESVDALPVSWIA